MANTSKLVLEFATMEGESMTLSYNHVDPEVAAAKVKSLVNGILTAGSIFAKTPVLAKGAKIVTTSESEYDLNA